MMYTECWRIGGTSRDVTIENLILFSFSRIIILITTQFPFHISRLNGEKNIWEKLSDRWSR